MVISDVTWLRLVKRRDKVSQLFIVTGLTTRHAIVLVLAETSLHHQVTVAELVLTFTVVCKRETVLMRPVTTHSCLLYQLNVKCSFKICIEERGCKDGSLFFSNIIGQYFRLQHLSFSLVFSFEKRSKVGREMSHIFHNRQDLCSISYIIWFSYKLDFQS